MAAGTVALNVTTYLDMALRDRPSSETPAKVAEKIAAGAGVDLSASPAQSDDRQQVPQQRASGLGSLMGYATGLGVGTAYGVVRLAVREVPVPLAAILLGAAAMASSDLPSIKLRVTDPGQWGASGWLADIVPHLAYGLVTAKVYESLVNPGGHRGYAGSRAISSPLSSSTGCRGTGWRRLCAAWQFASARRTTRSTSSREAGLVTFTV